ncbi:MAG: CsgG/HfaB family protein [Puniceicoccales bacterium]
MKFAFSSLCLSLILTGSLAHAEMKTLAVDAVKITPATLQTAAAHGSTNALQRIAQGLDGQLIDRLHNTRKFKVVAQSDLPQLVKQQEWQNSGNVDPNGAADQFDTEGANYMLVTTIDDFQDYIDETVYKTIGRRSTQRQTSISLVAKIYDTSTGTLLESANIQVSDQQSLDDPNYSVGRNGSLTDDLLSTLTRQAAQMIAERVADVVYPARVIALTGSQATINRGDGSGIAVGQIWSVFSPGQNLVDPDTGELLGVEEVQVGTMRITQVLPKFSKGILTENLGVEQLNIVRPQ